MTRRSRASRGHHRGTAQELRIFCDAVYQTVIAEFERTGKTQQAQGPDTRMNALWHTHQLWEGTHPKHMGTYRSTKRVSKMVYQLLITEGEEEHAEEMAAVR